MKSAEGEVCEKNNNVVKPKIDFRKAALQRLAVIVGLALVVSAIVYITPMPEEYFESCDRPCHELDWPMICRVKLTLEVYKSLSRSCRGCPGNTSDCSRAHCVSADGHSRGILAANRLLPGPSIQVCENDIMVIDVVNRVPGQGLTIHWRGQPQLETPFMDGVPMVTQCPIPSYTTFQYKFRAAAPGTHLYHAHSGAEASDGLYGAFVVRQAGKFDPQKKHYDFDLNEHVMVISEWSHGFAIQSILDSLPLPVESVLVNGKGVHKDKSLDIESDIAAPLSVFSVTPGKRYRFRVAYAGGVKGCPITLAIDNHPLLLIALDGHPVVPKEINSLILGKGERADFVLKSDKDVESYWIKVSTVENCAIPVYSAAILKYNGTKNGAASKKDDGIVKADDKSVEKITAVVPDSELNTVAGNKCSEERTLCVSEVQSLNNISEELSLETMQTTIYLPFHHKMADQHPNTGISSVDSVTFTFPPSPLLTQTHDVPAGAQCTRDTCSRDKACECVHVRKIPKGHTVELILVDQGGESDHVFHLHGYSFLVVGVAQVPGFLDAETIQRLDQEGQLFPSKNLVNPVRKDTVTIPKFGAVALRFKADNPGYWILRDERSNQWTRGLDVVLQVGETSDFVKPPPDFPKCGSYVGPHYFLI